MKKIITLILCLFVICYNIASAERKRINPGESFKTYCNEHANSLLKSRKNIDTDYYYRLCIDIFEKCENRFKENLQKVNKDEYVYKYELGFDCMVKLDKNM